MSESAEKPPGLREGQVLKIKLTDEQRMLIKSETGVDAEYIAVTGMGKPVQVVHVQGHLADDALID